MAGVHCAAFSLPTSLTKAATTPKLIKPLLSNSISTTLPPKKISKRKNHLRPKILKTLNKPLSIDPVIPTTPSRESNSVFEPPPDEPVEIVPVVDVVEEIRVSETVDEVKEIQVSETEGVAGEYNEIFVDFSPKSVLKVALGLLGVFILQTICAVWLMGNEDLDEKKKNLDEKNKNLNGLEKDVRGINKGNNLVNKNLSFMDQTKFEDKIYEIRAMAREARKNEEKKQKYGEEGGDVADIVNSKSRIGIGREIDARLVKVEKKLNSRRGKLTGSYRSVLDEFEDIEAAKEVDKTLMFMKKFKFRSPSTSIRNDAKGFSGSEDPGVHKKKNGFSSANDDATESISGRMEVEKNRSELSSTSSMFGRNDAQNLEKFRMDMGVGDTGKRFVTVDETSQGGSSVEVIKSSESRDLEVQNLQNFTKESHRAAAKSDKYARLGANGSSTDVVRDDQSNIKSDMWWLNLPYVLAILMHRGVDHEAPEGLFTLRITSQAQDQSGISYIVAFEDCSDANNFCYLLESFFADLGDFSTDIVPLFTKELHEEVKSGTKKMIVVKKRQLKLYAGQPLADVEKALQSLVEGNSSASATNV